ncbi:MAG: Nif3-like dinuclear metal center hexameric protein [Bacillota bacterium]|nr:Nif3-like dinuclear metal center hexameric protein [Bacillota bacterium]
MSIKCSEIIDMMEKAAPLGLAEDWDNPGLAVGDIDAEVKNVMVCLDVTSAVADEAASRGVNMIISHHPLIFKPVKSLRVQDSKGGLIHKLIKNGISVFCAHTNLDAAEKGLNYKLAQILGIREARPLKKDSIEELYKIVVFVPEDSLEKVRQALYASGAGHIGNYSDCTFSAIGEGTFTPLAGTNPYIGQQGKLEKTAEYRLETIVPQNLLSKAVNNMLKAHPYEEPAYDIYKLELEGKTYGMSRVGELEKPVSIEEFAASVKERLGLTYVRVIGGGRQVHKVAVASGGFDRDINVLVKQNIDVLVTGDVKYNDAVDIIENNKCVIDAGHFGTERIVVPLIEDMIRGQFPEINIISNTVETDPYKLY